MIKKFLSKNNKLLENFNIPRIDKLINNAIKEFDLKLAELSVLTEAASGYYMLTPIICALAGAENVYALTKDSQYGNANDIEKATIILADYWDVTDRISILLSRKTPEIGQADIITNLGHVRPIDKDKQRQ